MKTLPPEQIQKQKIEFLEDYLEHVKTGKPMQEWELKNQHGNWVTMNPNLLDIECFECRRKPKNYEFYWCVVEYCGYNGDKEIGVMDRCSEDEIKKDLKGDRYYKQLSPIKKEVVELI